MGGVWDLAKPGISGWGFALFLAVNAVQVWGGVFPFLPMDFQTVEVTLSFYVAQALSAVVVYTACCAGAYLSPGVVDRALPFAGPGPMVAGSVALIAAMYSEGGTIALIIVAGILLGAGCTSMALSWQRVFSSSADDRGDLLLVVGTGLSALVYFALYLCPQAVTTFLVPLVFVPLCTASLTLATRQIDTQQPMFTDKPRSNPRVYLSVVHDYWRSSVSAGAIGFVAGIMRALALSDVTAGHIVNVTSMVGALLSAAAVLVVWLRFSFHLSVRKSFRWFFPLLVVALGFMPFSDRVNYVDVFAGALYMVYAFIQMVLLVQCAQASRDYGVHPVFVYGFCSGIMHLMFFLGFLSGWFAGLVENMAAQQFAQASLLAVGVLGLTLYAVWYRSPDKSPEHDSRDAVGFMQIEGGPASAPRHRGNEPLTDPAVHAGEVMSYTPVYDEVEIPVRPLYDRLAKQCEAIRLFYRLSDRESEVMELIARGNTVANIAAKLSVSENTVRTHAKRIYAKLDIHSKQELIDLVHQFKPMTYEDNAQARRP